MTLRFTDRLGGGIRLAPADALIADQSGKQEGGGCRADCRICNFKTVSRELSACVYCNNNPYYPFNVCCNSLVKGKDGQGGSMYCTAFIKGTKQ